MGRSRGPFFGVVTAIAFAVLITLPATPAAPSSGVPPGGSTTAGSATVAPADRVAVAAAYAVAPGVTDLGPVGTDLSLTVDVGLAPRDPAGLNGFVNATEVPGTPMYGSFLSASAAAARFGATPSSVGAADAYFESFGLGVDSHADGLLLSVSGPASDLGAAFGTTFDAYRTAAGSTFVSHPTAATLPAVTTWTGAFGLSTASSFEPELAVAASPPLSSPAAGCGYVGRGQLSACQIDQAYDLSDLRANGTNGSGERIAVVDPYTPLENQSQLALDFQTFSQAEGLPTANLSFAYPVPTGADLNASGTNSGWQDEDPLDVQWSHAAAPGARILMVFSPNSGAGLYYAIDWIVATHAANVISMSWGEPEVGIFDPSTLPCSEACNASTDGSFAILNPVLELAAAEGIAAFAASGDCGAADGTAGVSAEYPASDPFVTGVGATDLTLTANGGYGSETAWSGNASGSGAGCSNQGGSGGGYSILPRPWWQTGRGTVPSRGRGVPDVAIVGGNASPVGIFQGGLEWSVWGTSVATPIWAGIEAVADQAHGASLGSLNPALYRVLRSPGYTTAFHEITSGNNGYRTGPGWNPVTGIGTPIVGNLTAALSATVSAPSNLSDLVYAAPRFGRAPLTVRFAASSSGGSGAYAFQGVDFGDGNASEVSGGSVAHTYTAPGVYSAQAFTIDGSANSTTSPPVVIVVGGGSSLAVTLNVSSSTPAVGQNVTFTTSVRRSPGAYLYNISFGDGTFALNLTLPTVLHAYPAQGTYCAEVVARTGGSEPSGGASSRVAVDVGGAGSSACGNPGSPLTLVPNPAPVRDAPADFLGLFTSSGGSQAPYGIPAQVGYASSDPYSAACACAILRFPGRYTLEEWENDSVNGQANATVDVTVAPALVATFSASLLSGPAPLRVNFSAIVSGGYLASAADTHWRFGDGAGAVGAAATATYAAAGEYVAIASVSDSGYGNASEAFVIDAEPASLATLGLSGTVTPAVNVSSGENVTWTGGLVVPPAELASATVGFTFGNGGAAFGTPETETYFAPNDTPPADELRANLSAYGGTGLTLASVPVDLPGFFVNESGAVPAVDALELSADLRGSMGLVPLAESSSASAYGPGGTTITWRFGDGGSATGPFGAHVYYAAGLYTLGVKAVDGYADTAGRLQVEVASASLALSGCGPGVLLGNAPYTVHLGPTPSGGAGPPYVYNWTLPNGTTSTASSVTLTFASHGTYEVNVVVRDAKNATYGCAWSIVVSSVPPLTVLEVLLGGAAAGVVLAAIFVGATRPPARERTRPLREAP